MIVKLVYNSKSQKLYNDLSIILARNFPYITLEALNEDYFKDRKKSYKVKGACSTRLTPFCAIYIKKEIIKAFYSDTDECKLDNIVKFLNDYVNENPKCTESESCKQE